MTIKQTVSLTIECSLSSFFSFIELLEGLQAKDGFFSRKEVRTKLINKSTNLNQCIVCLFGVTDSFKAMISIARQLKIISKIHDSMIFLKTLSISRQEQRL